jgi:aminoglycoside phosphotransferase (APT) family kinase protein
MVKSLSKTHVSRPTVEAITARVFGSRTRIAEYRELTDGYFNAAYDIELEDGLRAVLKVAPPADVRVLRYEADIMAAEVEALRLVTGGTEMPVPEVYAFDQAHDLAGADWFLMSFIDGLPLHRAREMLAPEVAAAIDRETGRLLRQVNGIRGPAFGYLARPAPPSQPWRDTFSAMIDGVLTDGRELDVALPLPYDDIRQRVMDAGDALDEVTEPRLVHWDLWDGNIRVDPATGRINGVFDFERALWGDPLLEVNFGVFRDSAEFDAGYGMEMLATRAQQRRRCLYNIYLFLIMVVEVYYRQYETEDQAEYARGRLAADLERLVGL